MNNENPDTDEDDLYWRFAILYGFFGVLSLSKLMDKGAMSGTLGQYATIGLGVCWPALALFRWQEGRRPRQIFWSRGILGVASVTAAISVLAVVAAISLVREVGPTLSFNPGADSVSAPLVGLVLLYFLPTVMCLFAGMSLFFSLTDAWRQQALLRKARLG
jgi:uncharacterized membrane protein